MVIHHLLAATPPKVIINAISGSRMTSLKPNIQLSYGSLKAALRPKLMTVTNEIALEI
jgi:hypothetical protein